MASTTPCQGLMTIAEYAQSRKSRGLSGGSRVAVYKAIESGRITTDLSGKINPTTADAQWEQRTRMAMPTMR